MAATWDTLNKSSGIVLTGGDLTASDGGSSSYEKTRCTSGISSGKFYWELAIVTLANTGDIFLGIVESSVVMNNSTWATTGHVGCRGTGQAYNEGTPGPSLSSFSSGDTIMVAYDRSAGKIWFGKNGVWLNSGDPAAGTNPVFSGAAATGTWYALFSTDNTSGEAKVTANFGGSAFAYTIPSGFSTLDNNALWGFLNQEYQQDAYIQYFGFLNQEYQQDAPSGLYHGFLNQQYQLDAYIPAEITEAITLNEVMSIVRRVQASITNNVWLADTFNQTYRLFVSLAEQTQFNDTSSLNKIAVVSQVESFTFSDALSPSRILSALITEGIGFHMIFDFNGEEFYAWIMNTDTGAVTRYENYNFNSFAQIGESYYGVQDDGIYLLEGADDNGTDIEATITTRKYDFGSPLLKRFSEVFIGLKNDDEMVLKVILDDETEYLYTVVTTNDYVKDTKVKVGRGNKSKYWQFELVSKNSADFTLEGFTFYPMILSRETR